MCEEFCKRGKNKKRSDSPKPVQVSSERINVRTAIQQPKYPSTEFPDIK